MKNKLKKLIAYSYKDGQLDEAAVATIANHLSRAELKYYIHLLKQEENKKQVFVSAARPLQDKEQKMIANLFPEKKIMFQQDSEMISGIRIVAKDMEYEMSLKQTFNDIIRFLSE